ncbi:MAG TPA: hypothetical protein VEZ14_09025 [Dehalococcoidia bacterium]|nr:hypothetical protein [Dehalococcoidia bacterium]
MEATFVAAVLVAALLAYDRLGGNDEVARRLYQVGLAVSLAFLVLSATAAFVRLNNSPAIAATYPNDTTDVANRLAASAGIDYALGVVFLILGIVLLRTYHTLPLGFVLGGVFLIFTGGGGGGIISTSALAQIQFTATQNVDVFVFGAAVVGTIALISYGLQLERESAAGDDFPELPDAPLDGSGDGPP